jgi:hypothetical protein
MRRPTAAGLLALLLATLVAALALAACGNADPFAGLYWEPATGRRVEIRKEGSAYRLYYGAAKQPFKAVREGGTLIIPQPIGGQTIVRPGKTAGTLEMESAGSTTVLKPLPEHQ